MKRNMYLILFISAVLLVFVRSKMSVNAAESTFDSSTGEYFYTWTESGSSYDVDGNITGSRNDTFTISGDTPFKILAFQFTTTSVVNGSECEYERIGFYLIPDTGYTNGTWNYYKNGEIVLDNIHNTGKMNIEGVEFKYAMVGNIYIKNEHCKNNKVYVSYDGQCTLPAMRVSNNTTAIDDVLKQIALDNWSSYKETENLPLTYEFDTNIETPKLVFTDGSKFIINNATEKYNIEIQGRFWSVDDIEMYKENGNWCYKYHSVIKNELSYWVTVDDNISSIIEHSVLDYGSNSHADLLSLYPISERSFTGGTNIVGDFFSGYQGAVDQFKLLLEHSYDGYTQPEMYVRFWYQDDNGVIRYGRWCHYYEDLYQSGYTGTPQDDNDALGFEHQSDVGLTDGELEEIENSGNSRNDIDTIPTRDYEQTTLKYDEGVLWFVDFLKSLTNSLGEVPDFFAKVFGFLPKPVLYSIGALLVVCVVLRIIGR